METFNKVYTEFEIYKQNLAGQNDKILQFAMQKGFSIKQDDRPFSKYPFLQKEVVNDCRRLLEIPAPRVEIERYTSDVSAAAGLAQGMSRLSMDTRTPSGKNLTKQNKVQIPSNMSRSITSGNQGLLAKVNEKSKLANKQFMPIQNSRLSVTSDLLSQFSMVDSKMSQNSNLQVNKMMDFFGGVKVQNDLKSISSQGDIEAAPLGSITEERAGQFDDLLLKSDETLKKTKADQTSDGAAKTNETDNTSTVSPFNIGERQSNASGGNTFEEPKDLPQFGGHQKSNSLDQK